MSFTVVMFALILAALFATFLTTQRHYASSDAYVHVQEEARRASNAMTRELRNAGGAITAAGSQLDFQLPLGFDAAPPCLPSTVCWGAFDQGGAAQPSWSIRYRLNGTQLVREIRNAEGAVQATRVLANDVGLLSFSYLGAPANTVTAQLQILQTSQQLPGGSMGTTPVPLVIQVKLRND
ncbi:MAG: hypothetical protein HYY90_00450 [Candidatus Omnitrophica bacterium]|nr:hypothetical protein [Candidatus Omnitrophota bacterium]